jgi:hypothetical protein
MAISQTHAVHSPTETFVAAPQSAKEWGTQTGGDMAAIHIGISGWRYTPWRGDFYSMGLPQKRDLLTAPGEPAAEGVLP